MAKTKPKTGADPWSDFIVEQIARNQKAIRATWIVGIILLGLVTCYMSGLVLLVRSMLEPKTAARMIGIHVEENLPSVMNGLEDALRDQAVPLANSLSSAIITTLPNLRQHGENQIELVAKEMLPLLREEIRSTLHAYVEAHEEQIRDFYQTHKSPEFAEVFIDMLVQETAKSLNKELLAGQHGLKHVKSAALQGLKDINAELARLLNMSAEKMTRSERLQRRLIVTWLHAVHEACRKANAATTPAR
ncbi:MAG: hypothetical protein JXR37_32750 [Kiritimatiellae bacterium]|nr:hypothetical protein [Kiritimatiellia bacterium]